MDHQSPLTCDEVCFTNRLLFETLNFNEPIEKTAEPKFRELGLSNGAIENFIRVMGLFDHTMLSDIYEGQIPPAVDSCPWMTQAAFLQRVSEIQGWLKENGGKPCDIEIFVRKTRK